MLFHCGVVVSKMRRLITYCGDVFYDLSDLKTLSTLKQFPQRTIFCTCGVGTASSGANIKRAFECAPLEMPGRAVHTHFDTLSFTFRYTFFYFFTRCVTRHVSLVKSRGALKQTQSSRVGFPANSRNDSRSLPPIISRC